jgi:hypothetical protein
VSRHGQRIRALRFRLRETNRQLTPYARQHKCGHCRARFAGVTVTRGRGGTANYTGLVRCGSPWACPVCAYTIARERAGELGQLLDRHTALGQGDCMVSLTTAHDLETPLKPMRQHVARAWQFVISGAPWKRMKAKLGIVGYVRGAEQTIGPSGWHPHLHVLLLTRRPLLEQQREELRAFVFKRWARAIAKPHKETGFRFRAPLEYGVDGKPVGVVVSQLRRDEYVAKLGLADELASAPTKRARGGRRTPWQLLYDVWAADGSKASDVERWFEYITEMHGAKQLTWSAGLRKRYALPPEQTDLELVEQDAPGVTIYTFTNQTWDDVIAPNVGLRIRILQLAESHDPDEAADRITKLVDKACGLEAVPF